MLNGKKSIAERIVYNALNILKLRVRRRTGLQVFHRCIENLKPFMEIRSRRIGGATVQAPTDIRAVRRESLAMLWLIQAARRRKGKLMQYCLAGELMDILNNRGAAVKKRNDMHKAAEANKAFSHYKW